MAFLFTGRFATAALVTTVFGVGFCTGRLIPDGSAAAQSPPAMTPQIINVPALTDSDLKPVFGDVRSSTFVTADGATVAVQTGNVPKHMHTSADEIQYIVEGSGKGWLGDKEVDLKPGDLIIIPKGTPHGGTIATSGKFKAIAIHTPPQKAGETKMLP